MNRRSICAFALAVSLLASQREISAQNNEPITGTNASSLREIQVLGLGQAGAAVGWWENQVVVPTTTGLWGFDPKDLHQLPKQLGPRQKLHIVEIPKNIWIKGRQVIVTDPVYQQGDTLYIWNTTSGLQKFGFFEDWFDYPAEIQISADGRYAAIRGTKRIELWDTMRQQMIYRWWHDSSYEPGSPENGKSAFALSNDGKNLFVADSNGTNYILDATGAVKKTIYWGSANGYVTGAAINSDGTLFAAAYTQSVVALWSPVDESRKRLVPLELPSPDSHREQYRLEFTPDGKQLLAVNTYSGQVYLIDTIAAQQNKGKIVTKFGPTTAWGHYAVEDFKISPDGSAVALLGWAESSLNYRLRMVDLDSEAVTGDLALDRLSTRRILVSGNSEQIAVHGFDEVALWNMSSPRLVDTASLLWHRFPEESTSAAALSANGDHLAFALDYVLLSCQVITANFKCDRIGHFNGQILAVGYSLDGKQLFTLSSDGALRVWNTTSWYVERATFLERFPDQVSTAVFNGDLSKVATGGGNWSGTSPNTIHVWDTTSGKLRLKIDTPQSQITAIAFNPKDPQLAAITDLGILFIWNLDNGMLLLKAAMPIPEKANKRFSESYAPSVTYNPEGTLIVSSQWDMIFVWRVSDGKNLAVYTTRHEVVSDVVFSLDGTKLFATGLDGTVSIWAAS